MPDRLFADRRLAAVYDPLDPDRRDLDAYAAMVDELGARTVLDLGEQARRLLLDAIPVREGAVDFLSWTPPRRFDVVRTGLDYVPPRRRAELVDRLMTDVVVPGGRLVVGVGPGLSARSDRPQTPVAV